MSDQLNRLKKALGDRYDIEREIGSGGMATVYLAEDSKHHRKVAVKVLRPELAATIGAVRFLREIEIAAQLHHPHILQLHDSGEASGFVYYVMPFVEEGSLRARLSREGPLPLSDAVRILRDVVDALAHAHKQGVVHRDIKPDNVMLSGRHALVTDFGIAKAVSEAGATQLTVGGVSLGTPGYMAPEQAAADPGIDHRADIYAVGILAYELLTGRLPFQHAAPQAMLAAHVMQKPEPVGAHREGMSPALEQLVMRCLEKKPGDRWQTAEDLLTRLETLVTPSGTTKSVVRAARPSLVRGNARRTLVAAGSVVVLGVAIWLLTRDRAPALEADRVLVAGFENLTGDTALSHLGSIAVDWLTRGLQETGVIRVVDARLLAGDPLGFAAAGSSGMARALTAARAAGAGAMLSGAFYKQGDSIQFQLQLTDAASGELRQAFDPVSGPLQTPLGAIELLRQRVMSTLAVLDRLDLRTIPIKPPTYDAYREFMHALVLSAQRDLAAAERSALRAAELDTTFTGALLLASGMMIGRAQYARAESVLVTLEGKQSQLSRFEQVVVDGQAARLRGDLAGWLSAARRSEEFFGPGFDRAEGAMWLNRPRETIEALEQLDPTDPLSGGRPDYWDFLHDAHHVLGEYDEALDAARRGREQYPDSWSAILTDVETLAALGRLDDVERRLGEAAASPRQGSLSDVMIVAIQELRAHSHLDSSRVMLERFMTWAVDRPGQEAASREHQYRLAVALALAGRLDAAKAQLEREAAGGESGLDERTLLGMIAASQGDGFLAMSISEQLRAIDDPYAFGDLARRRAQIAAMAGDRDEAVALLREAFAEGLHHGIWVHRDPAFESLRDYPPFQELLRPRG